MRIIAGKYKGRIIKTAKISSIRPTQDKVREALFDILAGKIAGAKFLDLFAGYGSVGIEALSRGACEVTFVEKNKSATLIIQKNLDMLGIKGSVIFQMDGLNAIEFFYKKGVKFDIIFADPPYHPECYYSTKRRFGIPKKDEESDYIRDSLSKNFLQKISSYDIVTPCGFVILQHYKKDLLPASIGNISLKSSRSYGDTVLSIYESLKGEKDSTISGQF